MSRCEWRKAGLRGHAGETPGAPDELQRTPAQARAEAAAAGETPGAPDEL